MGRTFISLKLLLAVKNKSDWYALNVRDRRFIQSLSKFSLPLTDIFYALFAGWIRDMNAVFRKRSMSHGRLLI